MESNQVVLCLSEFFRTMFKFYHSERRVIFNIESIHFNKTLTEVKVKETGEVFYQKIDGVILHPVCINKNKDIIYEHDVIEFIRYEFVKFVDGDFYTDENEYKAKTGKDDFYENQVFCGIKCREMVNYDSETVMYYYNNMFGLDSQIDCPIYKTNKVGSYLTNPELLDDYKREIVC